ncbi:MAG: hypothetical protein J6W45_06570, partial [Bacteroidales bacterium]|nr:hypothetical protein [Bacteroidales bacterium]
YRYGTTVYNTTGYYYTSNGSGYSINVLTFTNNTAPNIASPNSSNNHFGDAVRLVRDLTVMP